MWALWTWVYPNTPVLLGASRDVPSFAQKTTWCLLQTRHVHVISIVLCFLSDLLCYVFWRKGVVWGPHDNAQGVPLVLHNRNYSCQSSWDHIGCWDRTSVYSCKASILLNCTLQLLLCYVFKLLFFSVIHVEYFHQFIHLSLCQII